MNEDFLYKTKHHIHFVGIGGVSMSSLAKVMKMRGCTVTGSDSTESALTRSLEDLGISITYAHKAENVHGADLVVYTAAIKKDNPELVEAAALKIETAERSVFLGELMRAYKHPCCIAGTHGKTTTTSMAGIIMTDAATDPTVMVGGQVKALGGNLRIGKSDTFITESCEYVESFLKFHPETAIILNVEEDHLDYFTGIDHIISAFHKFAALVPENGYVIVNGTDKNALKAVENIRAKNIQTFGLDDTCTFHAENIKFHDSGCTAYDLMRGKTKIGHITLSVPGKHNVLNSMAAAIYALNCGVPIESIEKSLDRFHGTDRRFEIKGEYHGAVLVDDYAHHPTEIRATMESAKNYGKKKIIAVFQSHTYTRTKALLKEFSESFDLANEIIVTDIYAAREKDTGLVKPQDLVDLLQKRGKNATYIKEFSDIAAALKEKADPDTLIITVGAGNINQVLNFMKD